MAPPSLPKPEEEILFTPFRVVTSTFPVPGKRQDCHSAGDFIANGSTDGIVAGVRVIIDGAVIPGNVTQPTATTWRATFTPGLRFPANQPLVLIVTSADVDGPVELIVRFEHVPAPTLTLGASSISAGGFANSNTVVFNGTVANADKLQATVDALVFDNLLQFFQAGIQFPPGTIDGTKTIAFTATPVDASDPPTAATPVTFTLDRMPPIVAGLTTVSTNPLQITGEVTDATSGVDTLVAQFLDSLGTTYSVVPDSGGNFTFTPGFPVTSPRVVVFTATDRAGNSIKVPWLVTPPAVTAATIAFTSVSVNDTAGTVTFEGTTNQTVLQVNTSGVMAPDYIGITAGTFSITRPSPGAGVPLMITLQPFPNTGLSVAMTYRRTP